MGLVKHSARKEEDMERNDKIYVAGHSGMIGSAIVRQLKKLGYTNIICKTHAELDLTRQSDVEDFFSVEKPSYVFLSAGKVGGVGAMNAQPVEFLLENLQIQSNVMNAAHNHEVKKLIFLSSTTIYPNDIQQPVGEGSLATDTILLSGEGYALAKMAGVKLCSFYKKEYGKDFISVILANIYGYNGIFDIQRSHVVPAMIRRFHSGKIHNLDHVTIWGTGTARRELLFADDAAEGCIFLMMNKTVEPYYNLGCNRDYSILELANAVKKIVGYTGEVITDPTKPEGTARCLMNSERMYHLGWHSQTSLEPGITLTYEWFLQNIQDKDELYL